MGRYFLYRMHPLSVAEICCPARTPDKLIGEPQPTNEKQVKQLIDFGGYPEPFIRANTRFYNRWRRLRNQQLLREDLRDLTRIQELSQVEALSMHLVQRVGQLVSTQSLATAVTVSAVTIKKWLSTLNGLYFCFQVRPWFRNVSRALRKEPKYYLWDWSLVSEKGPRLENFVASALLKALHFWTDAGLGEFELYFLRDKQKREVDFLVTAHEKPWFIVEVKSSQSKKLSSSLAYFQEQTEASYAFQIAFDADPVHSNCFEKNIPVIVPARTFLSQLV